MTTSSSLSFTSSFSILSLLLALSFTCFCCCWFSFNLLRCARKRSCNTARGDEVELIVVSLLPPSSFLLFLLQVEVEVVDVVVTISLLALLGDYMHDSVSVPMIASTAGTNHGNEARNYKLLLACIFNLYSSYACGDDGKLFVSFIILAPCNMFLQCLDILLCSFCFTELFLDVYSSWHVALQSVCLLSAEWLFAVVAMTPVSFVPCVLSIRHNSPNKETVYQRHSLHTALLRWARKNAILLSNFSRNMRLRSLTVGI